MNLLSKFLFIFALALLGFTAKTAFASTCAVLPGGGNWNAAGTWGACAGGIPLTGDAVVATSSAGNLVINANTAALSSFDFTGYTATTSGGSTLSVKGTAASSENIIFAGTVTWTGNLNILPTSSATLNLYTNGKLITSLTYTVSVGASLVLQDNLSFANSKFAFLTLANSGDFDMNGKTISGFSTTSRVSIQSSVVGTSRTILLNGGTFAYADFTDVGFNNGGASLDLSAITGLSGNGLGNAMIGGGSLTLTTATTTYWIGNTGNIDDIAEWSSTSGGSGSTIRVPLPQDTCVFDANSFSGTGFTVSANQPKACTDVTFSAVGTDNPTLTFPISVMTAWAIYGSLTLDSGMTITGSNSIFIDFRSRSADETIDMQGVSNIKSVQLNAPGGVFTLLNDFTSTSNINIQSGTLDADIYDVTIGGFTMANSASAIVNMGSGTWTLTPTGNAWSVSTLSVINAETSTIVFSNTTTTLKQFLSAGKTYYKVSFDGCNITTTGSPTYNTLSDNTAGCARGLIFTGASTSTITSLFTTNATTTSAYAYASSTNASIAELKFTGGTVCEIDYMNFINILATPASTWFVGTNSTSTNSSGLTFTYAACGAPAATPPPQMIIFD